MTITIRDVARHLNLSITTVSRALDGYGDVAEETRLRVVQAAHDLGYVPSRVARQLRRQRTDAIGYILPTPQPRFADPFFSEFISGLGDEAASRNFDVLISTAPPGDALEEAMYERWVQSRRVDGIVLSRMRRHDWRVDFLASRGVPFVALGSSLNAVDYPFIDVDARAGFMSLVAHLVELGHQRIAYIGAAPDLMLQSVRLAGYREGIAALGLDQDDALIVEGDLTRQGGYLAAQQLLSSARPPTAIVGANDLTAIGALRAARERGLRIGRDLAVAGYDGVGEAEHTHPPLTTLNQPVYDIARRLVTMLLMLIANEALPERHVLLQPELLIRGSTTG